MKATRPVLCALLAGLDQDPGKRHVVIEQLCLHTALGTMQSICKNDQAHTGPWQQEQGTAAVLVPFGVVQNLCLGSSLQPHHAHL